MAACGALEIDNLFKGFAYKTLNLAAGGPGCYKTTYAVSLSYNALKCGYNVAYLDVESVIPIAEEVINQYKKMKCLIFLNDVKGYTIEGFLADFNFYFKHRDAFDYTAIVGDKDFEKAMVELFDKLMPGKAKYFDTSELDKAKEWIKQA